MIKNFVVDTNVLVENPDAVKILRNGKDGKDQNNVYIPSTVIEELDSIKRKNHLKPIVKKIVDNLNEYFDTYKVISPAVDLQDSSPDNCILLEIANSGIENPILVTNDRILQLKARILGVEVQDFKESIPFESEAEVFTGFVNAAVERKPINSFYRDEKGTITLVKKDGEKKITYQNEIWNTKPKNYTQNSALELILDESIDLVSIASKAGHGKTHLAVASALHLVLQKKRYNKIYIFKTIEEIGPSVGYLPGSLEEKIEPYMAYIKTMLKKLHEQRKGNNKVFLDEKTINPDYIEILPLTYIRGMNIENAFVIVDEAQNISRLQMRSLLTRMGANVKCVVCGDTKQVDNPMLNEQNNGLNWIVKLFSGQPNYGHVVLSGDNSRGPICDLTLNMGL